MLDFIPIAATNKLKMSRLTCPLMIVYGYCGVSKTNQRLMSVATIKKRQMKAFLQMFFVVIYVKKTCPKIFLLLVKTTILILICIELPLTL